MGKADDNYECGYRSGYDRATKEKNVEIERLQADGFCFRANRLREERDEQKHLIDDLKAELQKVRTACVGQQKEEVNVFDNSMEDIQGPAVLLQRMTWFEFVDEIRRLKALCKGHESEVERLRGLLNKARANSWEREGVEEHDDE